MDPFSVTASILTILGTLEGGISIANRLYNAPEDFQALLIELAGLVSAIRGIDELPKDYSAQEGLHTSLLAAKATLLELEELICYRLTKASGMRVDRLPWTRHKAKVNCLREQLKNKSDILTAMLAVLRSSSSIRMEDSMRSVIESLQSLQDEQRELRGMLSSLANRWVQQEERMESLSTQVYTAIQTQERLALLMQSLYVPSLLVSSQAESSTSQLEIPLQQVQGLGPPEPIDGLRSLTSTSGLQNIKCLSRMDRHSTIDVARRNISASIESTRAMTIMTTATIIFLPLTFVTTL